MAGTPGFRRYKGKGAKPGEVAALQSPTHMPTAEDAPMERRGGLQQVPTSRAPPSPASWRVPRFPALVGRCLSRDLGPQAQRGEGEAKKERREGRRQNEDRSDQKTQQDVALDQREPVLDWEGLPLIGKETRRHPALSRGKPSHYECPIFPPPKKKTSLTSFLAIVHHKKLNHKANYSSLKCLSVPC